MSGKSLRDEVRCWSCMKVLANQGSWSRHQYRCPAQRKPADTESEAPRDE